jgi:hypothetical protein
MAFGLDAVVEGTLIGYTSYVLSSVLEYTVQDSSPEYYYILLECTQAQYSLQLSSTEYSWSTYYLLLYRATVMGVFVQVQNLG